MAESEDAGTDSGTATATEGREQKRQTKASALRTPDLTRYYKRKLPALTPGDFQFVVDLLRPQQPVFSLDKMLEELEWIDEQAVLTGSLTLHRPDPADPLSLPITRGHLVRCRVRWGRSHTYQLWEMRAEAPQVELDTGVVTVPLKDDLAMLETGKRDWFFRTTKHRKHGWYLHEIAREVARHLGIKLGSVVKGTERMTLTMRNATGLAVLRAAAAQERNHTSHSLILRLRNRKLEIVPLMYNPTLYVLASQIQTALIAQKGGSAVPVTVLTGRAHTGSGKHTHKLRYTAYDRKVVGALGYVPQTKDYGKVRSHAELRRLVKRDLAAMLRLNDTISIQHQGIPFIWRGDAVQIDLPKEGYSGKAAYVWAKRADHTVQAGVYQSNWDFTAQDLVLAAKLADIKAAEARAAKSSGTPATPTGGGPRWRVMASSEDDPPGANASCGPLPGDRRGYSVLSVSGTSGDAGTAGQALSPGSLWPCNIQLILTNPANGRSTTAPHVDNGAGDSFLPVVGIYPQTRAELGLPNGWNGPILIARADGGNLHPVRGTPA